LFADFNPNSRTAHTFNSSRANQPDRRRVRVRALVSAVLHVATDVTKAAADTDIETTLRHMREITNSEHEMHAIILSRKRARRQKLAASPLKKPSLH